MAAGKTARLNFGGSRKSIIEKRTKILKAHTTTQPFAGCVVREVNGAEPPYSRLRLLIPAIASKAPPINAIEAGSGTAVASNSPENEL